MGKKCRISYWIIKQHAKKDTRKFLSTGQGSKNLASEIITEQYAKGFSQ
jgi:hypothetical protein